MKEFVFILIVTSLLCISRAVIIHYSEEHRNVTGGIQEDGYLHCLCDGRNSTEKVPRNSLKRIFQGIRHYRFCNRNESSPVCDKLTNCESCSAHIRSCKPISKEKKLYDCYSRQFDMNRRELSNVIGGRYARHASACSYPTNLKTADLLCTKFPGSITCKQKCIFGHTLKEGISRQMQCAYNENVWKPVGFEECQPFVDCTMSLVSTGKLECVTGTTKSAPVCNVSCARFEDKSGTSLKTYECRISGAWSMKLPFCAVSGSGLELVPAPRIKLHPLVPTTKKQTHKHLGKKAKK